MERMLEPNLGKNTEQFFMEQGATPKNISKVLPESIVSLLRSVLSEFKFREKQVVDVTRHFLDVSTDVALEDSVPMKAFFGLSANYFEQKEEAADEKIKMILDAGIRSSSEKVTAQKAKVRNSQEYKKLIARKLYYRKLKKDARTLEESMKLRLSMAQTKSANLRGPTGTNILKEE